MSEEADDESKKVYRCPEPGCDKVFSRSEHLSRHKLNHNPKVIYKCHYEDCFKTFVRNDLLKRHLKRHEARTEKIRNKNFKDLRKLGAERRYKNKSYDKYFMVGDSIEDLKEKNIKVVQLQGKEEGAGVATGARVAGAVTVKQEPSPVVSRGTLARPQHVTSSIRQGLSPPQQPGSGVQTPRSASAQLQAASRQKRAPDTAQQAVSAPTPSNNLLDWIFNGEQPAGTEMIDAQPPSATATHAQLAAAAQASASPPLPEDVDDDFSSTPNSPLPPQQDFETFYNNVNNFNIESLFLADDSQRGNTEMQVSPNSLLLNMFNDPTLFPNNGSANYAQHKSKLIKIDEFIYTDMTKLIPALSKNSDFTISNIEDLLETYWRFFHPSFPFLHKPSFSTVECPILLLLAMIMIGSRYVNCFYYNVKKAKLENKAHKFKDSSRLGISIAEPLRWLIFSSREFAPPSRLWVFQSLVMLEFYEKSCSSRVLHERSHLHHGTIIQLLRRSPSLGGNPIKLDTKNTAELTNHDIWKRWVKIESMKRITFTVFYLDVIDAIRYGHQVMVFAHQIQLPLPCDDDLWENMKVNNDENGTVVPKQPLFLDTLKAMLNEKKVQTTNFGKAILLAGILSVMFQAQQRELQISYGLEAQTSAQGRNWRDKISLALSIWRCDVVGSCCTALVAAHSHNAPGDIVPSPRYAEPQAAAAQTQHTPNSTASIYSTDEVDDSNIVVMQYTPRDTTCKHTSYHIAYLYMSVPHYDFIIMAGAPFWMNVRPSHNDRSAIRNRLEHFFQTREAHVCLVQCYLLLWETFLKPQDDPDDPSGTIVYSTFGDAFNRSSMIGMALVYIWDFNYVVEGIENTALKYMPAKGLDEIREQENGYAYLLRVRAELTELCGGAKLQVHFAETQTGAVSHQIMATYAANIGKVKNKQLLVGLLKMAAGVFKPSENELTREHGRLLSHCARRSCGEQGEICEDMYRIYDGYDGVGKVKE